MTCHAMPCLLPGEADYRREFNDHVERLFGTAISPDTTTATTANATTAASAAMQARTGNATAGGGVTNNNSYDDDEDEDEDMRGASGAPSLHVAGTLTDLITTYVEYGRSLKHFLTAAQMAVARLNIVDHVLTEEMFADR